MNFSQRRLAYFAFFAILWKWLHPSAPWLQVILYFVLAFAFWQLLSAIYRALLERLKPALYAYVVDVLCLVFALEVLNFLLQIELSIVWILPIALVAALLSFFNYRKTRNLILQQIAQQIRLQQLQEEQLRAEQNTPPQTK